jgi:hypothetical protein
MRVGPLAATTTFWLRTTPSTSSVSSMVPPTFLTIRMSLRSTLLDVGVTSRDTAETAIGARVDEYCETICMANIQQMPTQLRMTSQPWSSERLLPREEARIYLLSRSAWKALRGTPLPWPMLSRRTQRRWLGECPFATSSPRHQENCLPGQQQTWYHHQLRYLGPQTGRLAMTMIQHGNYSTSTGTYHLCCGMQSLNALKDSGTIVCDDHLSLRCLDLNWK